MTRHSPTVSPVLVGLARTTRATRPLPARPSRAPVQQRAQLARSRVGPNGQSHMLRTATAAVRRTPHGQQQHAARLRAAARDAAQVAAIASAERAQAISAAAAGRLAYCVVYGLQAGIAAVKLTTHHAAAQAAQAVSGAVRPPRPVGWRGKALVEVLSRNAEAVRPLRRGAAKPMAQRLQQAVGRGTSATRQAFGRVAGWLRHARTKGAATATAIGRASADAGRAVVTGAHARGRSVLDGLARVAQTIRPVTASPSQRSRADRWKAAFARGSQASRHAVASAWERVRPVVKTAGLVAVAGAFLGPMLPVAAVVYGIDKGLRRLEQPDVARTRPPMAQRFRRAVARATEAGRNGLAGAMRFVRQATERTVQVAAGAARAGGRTIAHAGGAVGTRGHAAIRGLAATATGVLERRDAAKRQRVAYDRWREGYMRAAPSAREMAADVAAWSSATVARVTETGHAARGLLLGLRRAAETRRAPARDVAARAREAMRRTGQGAQTTLRQARDRTRSVGDAIGTTALGATALAGSATVAATRGIVGVAGAVVGGMATAARQAHATGAELRAQARATQTPLSTVTRRAMFDRNAVPVPPAALTAAPEIAPAPRVSATIDVPATPRVAEPEPVLVPVQRSFAGIEES